MRNDDPTHLENLRRQLEMPRDAAAALGHETLQIIQAGFYISPTGKRVEIHEQVARSVQGTVTYGPENPLPESAHPGRTTRIEVINTTTFAAVQQLIGLGFAPAALNFASAASPGGGFLHGARAQEEALARSSTLWACLNGNPMYAYHNAHPDPFYTDTVIYSPDVLVLRDDDGALLETPYATAILTCAAVHANAVRQTLPGREGEIGGVMWQRILKVLAVALKHQHPAIVLGAWGCGAFGNDGNQVAWLFKKALAENFSGAFEQVIFAITDWSEDNRFIGPFIERFSN